MFSGIEARVFFNFSSLEFFFPGVPQPLNEEGENKMSRGTAAIAVGQTVAVTRHETASPSTPPIPFDFLNLCSGS